MGLLHRISKALAIAVLLAAAVTPGWAQSEPVPVIAAASDLQFALIEVAEAFQKETGASVKLAFGSSGNLARQLRQGAPFQLFFSADESYVEELAGAGILRDTGELYAVGRIALIVPHGSPLAPDGSLADLKAALADGRLVKFAIANPEHAPYGKRAEEALRHAGVWEALQGKLVLGENVTQAAQFATSADTQGGIIAYSLAVAPKVAALGTSALIPQDWHRPLRQRMALAKTAGQLAEQFYAFAKKPVARAIFRAYGFALPGESG